MNAAAVISDSGTLPEESSFFTSVGHPFPQSVSVPVPSVPNRWTRQDLSLPVLMEKSLLQAVDTAIAMNAEGDNGIPVPVYVEDVANKVVKIIQSYTGVVNKMVWRKK